jgi:replicative DNA helicase
VSRRQYTDPPPIAGRPPAHDLDAEAAVLSACLIDEHARDDVLDLVRPSHFYSTDNQLIATAVAELHAAGGKLDVVMVARWLRAHSQAADVSYLGQLVDATPSVANVRRHAQIVVDLARVRDVVRLCQVRAAEGYHPIPNVADWCDEVEAELHRVVRSTSSADAAASMTSLLSSTVDHLRAVDEGRAIGTVRSSGLRNLDALIGGLVSGDLIIEAGRPGMGKTALLYEHVLAVASDSPSSPAEYVSLHSLEMPARNIGQRLLAMRGNVDLGRMRRGQLTPCDWRGITDAAVELDNALIEVDDRASLTLLDVRATARRVAAKAARAGKRLGLVGVDYLQLMTGDRSSGSREQEVGSLSRGLKQLAKDLDVPVVALSQLNRGVETRRDPRPMMSDLRESGSIEQDADTVVMLYRPGYYDQQAGRRDDTAGETEAIVAKQRNGPTGVATLKFFAGNASFGDGNA